MAEGEQKNQTWKSLQHFFFSVGGPRGQNAFVLVLTATSINQSISCYVRMFGYISYNVCVCMYLLVCKMLCCLKRIWRWRLKILDHVHIYWKHTSNSKPRMCTCVGVCVSVRIRFEFRLKTLRMDFRLF